jgi:trans-2-enoyl-CoA reductase
MYIYECRPDLDKTLRLLTNLGGDINIPDTYLNSHAFSTLMADLPPCRLALNCVGGESATNLARSLAAGGTLVTYGGMSKRPLTLPIELIAYKQLNVKGFWMAKWYQDHSLEEKSKMIHDVLDMIRQKQLSFFFEMHDLDDFDHALKKATEPFNFRKVVLDIDYPDRLKEHDAKTDADYKIFETSVV